MYDPTGVGRELRSRVAAVRGLWHPVKQVMLLTWRRFAHSFFAPLLHTLVPGSRYHEKPQLIKLHSIFTYLRLAYPSVRSRLQGMQNDLSITLTGRSFVRNLVDLFEFYIVVVRSLLVHCSIAKFLIKKNV